MKSMNQKMKLLLALVFCGALFSGAGCVDPSESDPAVTTEEATAVLAEQPAAETEPEAASGDDTEIGINAVASFYTTCTNPSVSYDSSGAIIRASASMCKRKNGTWNTWPQTWTGRCTGNVANCNGWISCDPYCP